MGATWTDCTSRFCNQSCTERIELLWDILQSAFPVTKTRLFIYVMFCATWYHLYNLKFVKNTHGGVLLLVAATLLKVPLLHGCFSRFLNCTNGTKSRNASLITIIILLSYCKSFNPLMTNVSHHIETSQLTCIANQLTGFYMVENIGR